MLVALPYHENYMQLIRMELHALASVKTPGCDLCKFAIIGSGPLPLTSLCISYYLKQQDGLITCHNIDQNPMAISSSRHVCKALGHTEKTMCFHCTDANDAEIDLGYVDVVYVAALVGACSEEKRKIMASLVTCMRPGTLVVLRSARKSPSSLVFFSSHRYLSLTAVGHVAKGFATCLISRIDNLSD